MRQESTSNYMSRQNALNRLVIKMHHCLYTDMNFEWLRGDSDHTLRKIHPKGAKYIDAERFSKMSPDKILFIQLL